MSDARRSSTQPGRPRSRRPAARRIHFERMPSPMIRTSAERSAASDASRNRQQSLLTVPRSHSSRRPDAASSGSCPARCRPTADAAAVAEARPRGRRHFACSSATAMRMPRRSESGRGSRVHRSAIRTAVQRPGVRSASAARPASRDRVDAERGRRDAAWHTPARSVDDAVRRHCGIAPASSQQGHRGHQRMRQPGRPWLESSARAAP